VARWSPSAEPARHGMTLLVGPLGERLAHDNR